MSQFLVNTLCQQIHGCTSGTEKKEQALYHLVTNTNSNLYIKEHKSVRTKAGQEMPQQTALHPYARTSTRNTCPTRPDHGRQRTDHAGQHMQGPNHMHSFKWHPVRWMTSETSL